MLYEAFYETFSQSLHSLIPDNKELIDFISRVLHIDKRAASRRLQDDYQFRINEVLKLCSLLDISLDTMIPKKELSYQPSSLVYYPFDHLTEKEFGSIYSWLDKYKATSNKKGSYVLISSNILPEIFCFQYEYLIRLYKVKWAYYMEDLSAKNYMDNE
ncbi:MAG: hypothetical protein LUE93_04050, partial [Bacteroides sp.]|nr:hypothetical protein [Bacteroides sp.]